MQSGIDRGYFKSHDVSQQHKKEVTGLAIDQLNHYLISSSLDGSIKLWDFYRQGLSKSIDIENPIENLCYNHFNDLMAISTSELSVTILNAKNGLAKVRSFAEVSQNRITDLCFSKPDSKWLLVSSLDKSIKVFDILTSTLIDWVQFQRAPLSMDFALSGEFLATSHVGEKGIYLWSNKSFFSNLLVQKVPNEPIQIELPTLSKMEQVKQSHSDFYGADAKKLQKAKEGAENTNMTAELIDQMFKKVKKEEERVRRDKEDKGEYVMLSDQPYSKWQAIFHLEEIKERNKPTLAKQDMPKAPFFLFDLDKVMAGDSQAVPDDLLKQTFFTQEKTTENKLAKHGFQRQLRQRLKELGDEVDGQ